MKKLLIIFILLLFTTLGARAENITKITGLTFDTSNSLLFIGALNNPELKTKEIKPVVMQNPLRVYFDINSSVLVNPKQDLIFASSDISEVKIGQFSVNPDVVRVVMYLNSTCKPEDLKIIPMQAGIVVKIKSLNIGNDYFQNTYREEKTAKNDYYENLTVSEQTTIKLPPSGEQIIGQIQQAFNEIKETTEIVKKNIDMRTKYYINSVSIKNDTKGFLVNGFGAVTIEKSLLLTEPTRIVFDVPNTFVNPAIRNKEYKLPNSEDTIKIGQFERNKARIVITSEQAANYLPIYSSDDQSLLIANPANLKADELIKQKTNIVSYYTKKSDNGYDAVITADEPVVHAVKRENNKFIIYLFNGDRYNEADFTQATKGIADFKLALMPSIGMRISVPISSETQVKTYMSTDGKSVKLSVKEPKRLELPSFIVPKISKNGNVVVLDAGHGGSDYGAIRDNVNEKDINLDVTMRVASILSKKGYDVHLVRDDDTYVSLEDRVGYSESVKPDVFVSIHVNSSTKEEITGVETHYYRDDSIRLAEVVHKKLTGYIKTTDRGLFKSKFYVINHTTSPAILVEIGFISNPAERDELLTDKRKQYTAKAIAEGIIEYLK
ncbi:N-acetylmuramoyl-L-alanine amidase [bacterium]|nr:N-acetylmuramoyl-L-alanine amidase [bacterium]